MGLLVFVRNLLLALCLLLVLGFLYYSAWKLHLLQWEDSGKYGHWSSPRPGLPLTCSCNACGSRHRNLPPFSCCGLRPLMLSPTSVCMLRQICFLYELSENGLFFRSTSDCTRMSSSRRLLSFLISQRYPTLTSQFLPWGLGLKLVYFSALRTFLFTFSLHFQFDTVFVLFPLRKLSPSSLQPFGIELASN